MILPLNSYKTQCEFVQIDRITSYCLILYYVYQTRKPISMGIDIRKNNNKNTCQQIRNYIDKRLALFPCLCYNMGVIYLITNTTMETENYTCTLAQVELCAEELNFLILAVQAQEKNRIQSHLLDLLYNAELHLTEL